MLTRERLDGLRAAQRNAPTTGGEKINLLKSETLGELLGAAEALLRIKAIDQAPNTCRSFSEQVSEVLNEWERG